MKPRFCETFSLCDSHTHRKEDEYIAIQMCEKRKQTTTTFVPS